MAFSLRSFFGKGGSDNGAAATMQPPDNMIPAPIASSFQSAADPAFANTMLFKTAVAETPVGVPVSSSPFALAGGTPVAGLTIGDLLPWIPADVAKNPGLPLTHPVVLPDPILEGALRSGRASIPLFELFRVCPVMFLVPVGPHDPREIPLPPHKIAHLIPGNRVAAAPQNPFTLLPPDGTPTPSSPFGTVSAPREDDPSTASPVDDATTLFNPTPFGLMAEPASIVGVCGGSRQRPPKFPPAQPRHLPSVPPLPPNRRWRPAPS